MSYLRLNRSRQVDLPQRLNKVLSVKPRAGISYSSICTCIIKYNPLVFLNSIYVNAFTVNPLDHFRSKNILASERSVAPAICTALKNKV